MFGSLSLSESPFLVVSVTRKILRLAGLAVLYGILLCIWLWGIVAIAVYEPWPSWLRLIVVLLWAILFPLAAFTIPYRVQPPQFTLIILAVTLFAGYVAIRVLWSFWLPSNDRDWSPLHAHLATATFRGNTVTIENVRDFTHLSRTEYNENWETRSYDIRELTGVEMAICPFQWGRGGLAHTFLTFSFSNGDHLAISVEARLERDERYNFLLGLFRAYELIYIIGDERDILGLRTNGRGDPLYLYTLNAEPPLAQAVFVMMLTRANRLARQPEFYNTMTNCCASNMVRHLVQASQGKYPFDPRVLLPGYLDDFAAEHGALRLSGPLEEVRERHLVNDRNLQMTDSVSWSRQIRSQGEQE
jgi:hypothetical protein